MRNFLIALIKLIFLIPIMILWTILMMAFAIACFNNPALIALPFVVVFIGYKWMTRHETN